MVKFSAQGAAVCRTGGEQQVGDFALQGLEHAALHFTDVLWPHFAEVDLEQALAMLARSRRRLDGSAVQAESAVSLGAWRERGRPERELNRKLDRSDIELACLEASCGDSERLSDVIRRSWLFESEKIRRVEEPNVYYEEEIERGLMDENVPL